MVAQVTPFSVNRRGTRLVIDVTGRVEGEVKPAFEHAIGGCLEALINLSGASAVTSDCLRRLVSALPPELPVSFCSVPPSVLLRLGEDTLRTMGKVIDD